MQNATMPEVGFEPTRTNRPAELESAPLDHSGIQARRVTLIFTFACNIERSAFFGKVKNQKRGRAGIEPATSPTRRENHTSRPTARAVTTGKPPTRIELVTLCLRSTCSAN